MRIIHLVVILIILISLPVASKESINDKRDNPYQCFIKIDIKADNKVNKKSLDEIGLNKIKSMIISNIETFQNQDPAPYELCQMAELLKRTGDYRYGQRLYRAEEFYRKAIEKDPDEPAYELFYANYLRVYRGPGKPLFQDAEEHYYKALEKLSKLKQKEKFDETTESWIKRSRINLYQTDGLTLFYYPSSYIEKSDSSTALPFLAFSTVNNYAKSTTEFDEVDDARDFTTEALFAESRARLNRPLTKNELKQIARHNKHIQTLNRFRFRVPNRYINHFPSIDVFYRYRKIKPDAQITNFFEPEEFNNFHLNEYGISLENTFSAYPFDFFLRGIYTRTRQEGLIEFEPNAKEDVDHFEANAAVSKFFGPNKLVLRSVYVYQNIDQDVWDTMRDRKIFAANFSYFLPRLDLSNIFANLTEKEPKEFEERFNTRGLEIFGGFLYDKENYGDDDVERNDFFIGASLRGIKSPLRTIKSFDITVQPTVFTAEIQGNSTKNNAQYRTNFNLLCKIIDEEAQMYEESWKFLGLEPAFLHLAFPFRHDLAVNGPDDFENFKFGVQLSGKFFSEKFRGTTFLASLGYSYQRFYKLNKDMNLFSFSLSMGF